MTLLERPKRLLWLLRFPAVPPANGGDSVYSRKLIESTAAEAEVQLLSFTAEGLAPADADRARWELVPLKGSSKALSVLSPLPNIAYRYRQDDYLAAAVRLGREADGIVVDHIGLFPLVAELKRALGPACPPVIVINHDHAATLRRQMAQAVPNPVMRGVLTWDGIKSARLERQANQAADGLTAITTTDVEAFRQEAPGVPTLLLMPGYDGPVVPARTIDESTPRRMCILGARSSMHKEMVLRLILDAIVASGLHRRMIVDVVGGDTKGDPRYDGINFLGYVEDLDSYLSTVRLGLVPDVIGGGFKLRALTHVFQRVPMLALRTAMRGMTLRENLDFAAVDDLGEMVAEAERLVDDLPRLDALQNAAFDHCRGRFDWADRGADIVSFIAGLRAGGATTARRGDVA
jgi:polysaccharide biosynthesis protein PslH